MGQWNITSRKCPVCKKEFCPLEPSKWAYRSPMLHGRVKLFCSWGCLRKDEKEREGKHKTA